MEVNILDYLITAFTNIYLVFKTLLSSILGGIDFYLTMFMNIPKFLFELFDNLPLFFRTGLLSAFGILVFVLVIKLVLLVLLK